MRVNTTLPMWLGVSQQPPQNRPPGMADYQENVLGTIAEGATKRPPAEFVALLNSKISNESFVYTINRSIDEKYLVVINSDPDEPIEVFNLVTYTKCNVIYEEGTKAYAVAAKPREVFKALTIADYTFIANNTVRVQMSGIPDPDQIPTAIAFVQKGIQRTSYYIYVNNNLVASYTTGETETDTAAIATDLYSDLVNNLPTNSLVINTNATGALNYWSDVGKPANTFIKVYVEDLINPANTIQVANVNYTYDFDHSDTEGNSYYTYNATKTADNLYNALHSSLNHNFYSLERAKNTIILRKIGSATFNCSVQGAYRITKTLPGASAQWNIQHPANSSFIQITRFDGGDFDFRVSDSYGEQALIGGKGVVQKVTDLPPKAIDGLVLKVEGDPNSGYDNHYMKYVTSGDSDTGVWVEAPKPGLDNAFDNSTMPHKLARTGVNEFTFGELDWAKRAAGDEVSCSEPSFVGNTINDLYTFKGRLGFLSGENFICSRPNDYLNFWPAKASRVSDSDPIDLAPDSPQVFTLRHAVPFNTSLVLFSDQLQFIVSSGDNLFTSKTVTADQTTAFETSPICKPVPAGPNVYFVTPAGKYSQIREYYVQPDTMVNDAFNTTVHVPRFLPKNIVSLAASSAFDILFALSSDEPKRLYVYKYTWSGEEKAQQSWSFWSFDDEILGMSILDNYLYLVMKGTDGAATPTAQVYLGKINLEKDVIGNLPFRVHLDKMTEITGVYNPGTKKTTWTLPYNDGSSDFVVVDSEKGNRVLNTVKTSANTIEAPGDHSATSCFVGKNYTSRYRFSEWFILDSNTDRAILGGNLQIKEIAISYVNTGYFRVEITPKGFDKETYENTCVILGQSVLGEPSIIDDTFEILTSCESKGCKIEIINDTYLPSEIELTSFVGSFHIDSKSV